MEIDNERVQTIGLMFYRFFDEMVKLNITENEWEGFTENKRKVYSSIGYPTHSFQMDESGSRWIEYDETEVYDENYYKYQRALNSELEEVVVKWVQRHGERGWNNFLIFLENKKDEFIGDVENYYTLHGSYSEMDSSDDEDYTTQETESFNINDTNDDSWLDDIDLRVIEELMDDDEDDDEDDSLYDIPDEELNETLIQMFLEIEDDVNGTDTRRNGESL